MKARGVLRIHALIYFPFCSSAIRHVAARSAWGRNEKLTGNAKNNRESCGNYRDPCSSSCPADSVLPHESGYLIEKIHLVVARGCSSIFDVASNRNKFLSLAFVPSFLVCLHYHAALRLLLSPRIIENSVFDSKIESVVQDT